MACDHRHYVPCLLWKQGEYLAVSQLSDKAIDGLFPLFQISEIGYDHAKGRPSKSIDEHLSKFAVQVRKRWGQRPCFMDPKRALESGPMADGTPVAKFVFDELRMAGCSAIPVTGLNRGAGYQDIIRSAAAQDGRGVCIRLSLAEAARAGPPTGLARLLSGLRVSVDQCDCVLDLGAPASFTPIAGFCKAITRVVEGLPHLNEWRSLTVLATSVPGSLRNLGAGSSLLPRGEWLLYKALAKELEDGRRRLPTFGDYGIRYPYEGDSPDYRVIKYPARVVYTVEDAWYLIKGRDLKEYGYRQYPDLFRQLVGSRYYCGRRFSAGDRYISDNARGSTSGPGSPNKCIQVGTNHHIEMVTQDIANLFGP